MPNKTAALMDALYEMPARPLETQHYFGSGVYVRRQFVPKNEVVRLHVHNYDHLSVAASGRGRLAIAGNAPREICAGDVIEIKAGVQHAFVADEDTIWLCVHGMTAEEAQGLYGHP